MKTMFSFRPVEIWTSSIWIIEFAMDLPQNKSEQKTILLGFLFRFFPVLSKEKSGPDSERPTSVQLQYVSSSSLLVSVNIYAPQCLLLLRGLLFKSKLPPHQLIVMLPVAW